MVTVVIVVGTGTLHAVAMVEMTDDTAVKAGDNDAKTESPIFAGSARLEHLLMRRHGFAELFRAFDCPRPRRAIAEGDTIALLQEMWHRTTRAVQ